MSLVKTPTTAFKIIAEENKIRSELGKDFGERVGHDEFEDWFGDGYTIIPMSEEALNAIQRNQYPNSSDQFIKFKKEK